MKEEKNVDKLTIILSRLPENTQATQIEELLTQLGFTFDKVEAIDRLEAEKVLGTQNKREAAREASKEDFNAGQHARISFKSREDRK
jgi:hypothetical protein